MAGKPVERFLKREPPEDRFLQFATSNQILIILVRILIITSLLFYIVTGYVKLLMLKIAEYIST